MTSEVYWFRTRDNLITLAACSLEVADEPSCIMRPLRPYPPMVHGIRKHFIDVRKYERTTEKIDGIPVYQEVA